MTSQMKFFPSRHPVLHLSDKMKSDFVRAQESVLSIAFPNAFSFCERVIADLKLSIAPLAEMRDQPASEVADLELADLEDIFDRILCSAEIPESARKKHSENLSRRAQLLRAFDSPETVLEWVTDKVVGTVDKLPKTAADIEVGSNRGDVLDPCLLAANQALLCKGDFKQY